MSERDKMYPAGSVLVAPGDIETTPTETDYIEVIRSNNTHKALTVANHHAGLIRIIRYVLAFNTTGFATGVTIVTIPAGCIVVGVAARILTPNNASVSAALSIGYGASLNEYVSAFNAKGASANDMATIVTGAVPSVPSSSVAKTIQAKMVEGGTASTAGSTEIFIQYTTA